MQAAATLACQVDRQPRGVPLLASQRCSVAVTMAWSLAFLHRAAGAPTLPASLSCCSRGRTAVHEHVGERQVGHGQHARALRGIRQARGQLVLALQQGQGQGHGRRLKWRHAALGSMLAQPLASSSFQAHK